MHRNGKSNKLIWILAVLVLLTVLSAVGVKGAFPDAIALEQAPRCGMEEHVHSEECYVGDILVCREKMHTHTENCYIVLLVDNDINELLTRVDVAPDNNLESLISATVLQASMVANLNTNVSFDGPLASAQPNPSVSPSISPSLFPSISPSLTPGISPSLFPTISPSLTPSISPSLIPSMSPSPSISPSADPTMTPSASPSQSVTANQPLSVTQQAQPITNRQIVALNSVVDTSQQGVVLNEHLTTFNLSASASEEELLAALLSGGSGSVAVPTPGTLTGNTGASTLAVTPVTPSNTNGYANYYVFLDGQWVCIGKDQYTNVRISSSNYRAETTQTITNLINTALGLSGNSTVSNATIGNYIYYNTSSATSYSWTTAGYRQSGSTYYTTFTQRNNTNAVIYARIGGGNTTDPSIKFYTVTYDYNYNNKGTYTDQIVRSGQRTTAPAAPARDGYTFTGWYTDADCTSSYNFDSTVTSTRTLYAGWKKNEITVTWIGVNGTTTDTQTPTGDSAAFDVPALSGEYNWVDQTTSEIISGDSITVSADTTFVAKLKTYTVTFDSNGGSAAADQTVEHGKTASYVTPNLEGHTLEGWYTDPGCADDSRYDFSTPVTQDITLYAKWELNTYTVTFIDEDGNETSQPVEHGKTVTLPALEEGYSWRGDNGSVYVGGATSGAITGDITFTATKLTLTINYNVNFPSELSSKTFYPEGGLANTATELGVSAVGVPTINKNTASTYTAIITVSDTPHYAEALNYREVFYAWNGSPAYEFRSVYFLGWQATVNGQTEIFEPGEAINWTKLCEMAGDSGTINFTGLWESDGDTTVTFYVNYSAAAADAGGNFGSGSASDYTPEVFCGHLFGIPSNVTHNSNPSANALYGITGAKATSSVVADGQIRALYGSGASYDGVTNVFGETIANGSEDFATTLYMIDFPDDADVLARIKLWYAEGLLSKTLKYDDGTGNTHDVPYTVNTDGSRDYYDLDTDHYSVRWYVFKSQDDGWHVDGRLIKKTGVIKITKNFEGNETIAELAVQATRDKGTNYAFITAFSTGYYGTNGEFVPYSDSEKRSENLFFWESSDNGVDHGYRYDADTDTYSWIISDVSAGEVWEVTEHPVLPNTESMNMGEWVWTNSHSGTSDSGLGYEDANSGDTKVTTEVTGITHAADAYNENWLVVNFRNVYHRENTILIRKVEGKTLNGLPGAIFNLYQVDEDGNETLMHFDFDSTNQVYVWNEQNIGQTDLAVNESGFLEYTVEGFTYETGNILVREKLPPNGYGQAPDITVGFLDGTESIGVVGIAADEDDSRDDTYYAVYENGVLTVKNYSASAATVTAEKYWDCEASYYAGLAVRMELLANGQIASATIPGFNNDYGSYFVYLDAKGAYFALKSDGTPNYLSSTPWEYTWTDLPAYINGAKVDWSLRETLVGKEVPDATGNFPNWIVSQPNKEVSNDGEGTEIVTLTISNTPKRAMLYLTKYDTQGNIVPGAGFELREVDNPSEVRIETTDPGNGRLSFDNLKYETWYTLTETDVPAGYLSMEGTVYVKLANTGVVTVTTDMNDTTKTSMYVFYPGQANNVVAVNTAGVELPATGGSGTLSYTLGGALLMAAALLMLYKKSRRKEDAPYV